MSSGYKKILNRDFIAACVFALHLGKETAIMSSVLTTLVTKNTVNRVKSDSDGALPMESRMGHMNFFFFLIGNA